jgi:membrane-bound lytic murein transglycosylase D
MTSLLALRAPKAPRRFAAVAVCAALWLAGCASAPRPDPPTRIDPAAVVEPEEPLALAPKPAVEPPPPAPTPEPSPTVPARIADGGVLFQRMAAGFEAPVCVRGEHNQGWRRRYAAHPRALEDQLRRALPLMAWVTEQVEARQLPMEFALVPLIESGFRPEARGPGGPTGLWQMIGSTARNHGVIVGGGYDGRLSPVDSTSAALAYLETLHDEFGDWRATAMAYNAGEGRLRRAFARSGDRRVSGERRLPHGLSGITYAYVAKLHALACLITEPQRHGLDLPTDAFLPLEASVAPAGARSLDAVASAWSTDAASLRRLNPAYRNGLPRSGAPRALLHPRREGPAEAEAAVGAGPRHGETVAAGDAAAPREHVVRSGDTLWQIARRYGTSVRALAALNGLRVDAPLRLGRRLMIPD